MTALAAIAVGFVLLAQPPRDNARPTPESGTAAIRGRVVASDTGAPVKYAHVSVFRAEPMYNVTATTDRLGRFTVDHLPAGAFQVTAYPPRTTGRHLMTPFGGSATRPTRRVPVAEGQTVSDIEIRLEVGASISGRVVDDSGEPLANVRVSALRRVPGGRPLPLNPSFPSATDDQGRFRLFALAPGEAVLFAEPAGDPIWADEGVPALVSTYYPQGTSENEARPIRLTPGTEIQDLEIAMVRTRTFRISGAVVNSRGLPAPVPPPQLVRKTMFGGSATPIQIGADGRFTIRNLAPGPYQIVVRPPPDAPGEYATVPFTVGDADVEDLIVTTKPAFDLTGRVTFEPDPPEKMPGGIRILAYTVEGESYPGSQTPVQPNGTFALKGVFGPVLLRADGGPIEFGLKTVRLGNQDITDVPTEFRPDDLLRLNVVMTTRPSAIGGVVLDDRDAPTRDYIVVLFPADRAAWIARSSRVRTGAPDRLGRFRLIRVRPGRYRIAALPPSRMVDPSSSNEALFDAIYADATEILINEDEQRAVELKRLPTPNIEK